MLAFVVSACTNFTYDPYEFSIGMNMLWNEESIFQRNVSGMFELILRKNTFSKLKMAECKYITRFSITYFYSN